MSKPACTFSLVAPSVFGLGLLPRGNPELLLLTVLLSVELLIGEARTVFDNVVMVINERNSSRGNITKNIERNSCIEQVEFNYHVFKNTIYKNLWHQYQYSY